MNKVKFGLSNCFYAVATIAEDGSATYAKPVRWAGAVSLSLDQEGDTTQFRADNMDYWVGNANNGYSGDFETALIPDSAYIDIFEYFRDNNGNLVEDAGATGKAFALLFQFEGDEHATRHVLYNVNASRPSVAGSTTEATITPETETVNLTASSVYVPSLEKNIVKARANKGDANYDTFFDAVELPTSATTFYTVSFNVDGGTPVASQSVEAGMTATMPTAPTKDGFDFDGWYADAALTTVFDFSTAINSNTVVYAKWVEV